MKRDIEFWIYSWVIPMDCNIANEKTQLEAKVLNNGQELSKCVGRMALLLGKGIPKEGE